VRRDNVDFLFGLARNSRLQKIVASRCMRQTAARRDRQGGACVYRVRLPTRDSWARARRVVAKAEYLDKAKTAFVVTSITPDKWRGSSYTRSSTASAARWKPHQGADVPVRLSPLDGRNEGNQLRLYLSALAYTLVEALRRLALKGTEWPAQVDTIRLKLFKIGAIVRISARACGWNSVPLIRGNRLRSGFDACAADASTATKQLLHTNPRIGIAELCDKSGFDLRSALLCLRQSPRQGDSMLRNGPTMPAHPVAHDKIDLCEKWRLDVTPENSHRLNRERKYPSVAGAAFGEHPYNSMRA